MRVRYLGLVILLASCASAVTPISPTTIKPEPTTAPITSSSSRATTTSPTASAPTVPTVGETPTIDEYGRPAWLGTVELPVDAQGFGEVRPTPPELIGRAFGTVDVLPPPPTSAFGATIQAVPDDVIARSTWTSDCPVTREELAYVTVTHVGFDGQVHTGELIVHESVAAGIVDVFADLFDAQYPIEEMRVVEAGELELPPTGDGNNTTSFVCRAATGGTNWSQHAYGLAIDINPFQNPYLKGDLVLPELATYYTDRTSGEVGMIEPNSSVTDSFAALGWGWGGDWSSLKDWMHFSQNGR